MYPSEFIIPAATEKDFGILVIPDGVRGVYLDHDRGTQQVVVPAKQIAVALVDDYAMSQPAQDQTAGPGLFHVDGTYDSVGVKKEFPQKVQWAENMQKAWWKKLVRLADDTWQAAHIIAQIGDLDRVACRQLGLKRDWLDDSPDQILKCPVCTTLITKAAIVCFACHVILRPEEYNKFVFAGNVSPVQSPNVKH